MNPIAITVFTVCLVTGGVLAYPGLHGGSSTHQLMGVPDISSYGKLTYPHYDLIDLGSSSKDNLPPAVVEITKHISTKVPQPYPVKVPVHVPVPVHIPKPYPVVETKIVKVPVEVPVEVTKNVPVHIEVPKPYPVPSGELKTPSHDAPVAAYGGHFEGGFGNQLNHDQGSYGGFEGSQGGYEQQVEDHSGGHEQLLALQQQHQESGWAPLGGGSQGGYEVNQETEGH